MTDAGAEYVDRKLYNLEKRVAREYRRANRDVQAKLNNYLMKFSEQEKIMRARLEAGDITQKDYNDFIFRKTMTGKRWEAMRDTLASDYHNANMIAKSITEGYLPGAYAINHDYATYEVEHDGHFDTNYTLYNRRTAENLLRDSYKLLPDPKPGTEAYRRSQSKDLRWNMQKVQSAVLQGILQGSRLSEVAARLEHVTDMNHSAAVRNARSMMTAAQNAGRQDAYERARKMSINLEKVWIATLDNRTRHSHRWVHGERRPIQASFSNGCRFPGDPEADPSEYYNCRCTMGAAVEGLDLPIVKHSPKMGDMTFEEWREGKMPKKEKAAALIDPDATNMLAKAYDLHSAFNNLSRMTSAEIMKADGLSLFADYKALPKALVKAFNTEISALAQEYDTPLSVITVMDKGIYQKNKDKLAFVVHDYEKDTADMVLNPVALSDTRKAIKAITKGVESNYFATIDKADAKRYIAVHEFAHSLISTKWDLHSVNNRTGADFDRLERAQIEIRRAFERYKKEVEPLQKDYDQIVWLIENAMNRGDKDEALLYADEFEKREKALNDVRISRYSLENADEFFAEAFTNEKIGVQSKKYGREMMVIADRYFKRT